MKFQISNCAANSKGDAGKAMIQLALATKKGVERYVVTLLPSGRFSVCPANEVKEVPWVQAIKVLKDADIV